MSNIVWRAERSNWRHEYVNVTDWTMTDIREYVKANAWPNLKIHLPDDPGGQVFIERLPK